MLPPLVLAALLAAKGVYAHGYVQYITANGVQSLGYDPGFRFQNPAPAVAGWYANNPDIGFVPPTSYDNADIICHKSSQPGQKYSMHYFPILNSNISREVRGGETYFERESRHMPFLLLLPYKENANAG